MDKSRLVSSNSDIIESDYQFIDENEIETNSSIYELTEGKYARSISEPSLRSIESIESLSSMSIYERQATPIPPRDHPFIIKIGDIERQLAIHAPTPPPLPEPLTPETKFIPIPPPMPNSTRRTNQNMSYITNTILSMDRNIDERYVGVTYRRNQDIGWYTNILEQLDNCNRSVYNAVANLCICYMCYSEDYMQGNI